MQNGSTDNKPRRSYLPWLIVLAVIVVLGIFGISTYNGLAKQSQSVDSQWANVETVMQRRADLTRPAMTWVSFSSFLAASR